MFLNNSYFNVLRKLDAGWQEKHSPSKNKYKAWRKRFSRSSSVSSKSRAYASSISSAESGHYSEDANSGYYGDDEIDPCPQCRSADFPISRTPLPNIEDYDIISIEVNFKNARDRSTRNSQGNTCRHVESVDFDEFVVIPSSREQFCSGNFKHSTPIPNRTNPFAVEVQVHEPSVSPHHSDMLVTCTPKIVTCSSHATDGEPFKGQSPPCTCFSPQKPVRFRLDAPPRSSFNDNEVWWRENIAWQLKQRNKTQTQNFIQLNDVRGNTRTRVRIDRDVAHYLNRYGEFRPHNEMLNTALVEMESNALDKGELLDAIRYHGAGDIDKDSKCGNNTLAQLALEYMRKQKPTVSETFLETDDEERNRSATQTRRRVRSRPEQARVRLFVPRWKDSITNQLQMRNLLECKYFTDAIARRSMSQLSISVSQCESKSGKDFEEYDVISSSEDVSSVVSGKTLTNSLQSGSQGYHSAPTFFSENNGNVVHMKLICTQT